MRHRGDPGAGGAGGPRAGAARRRSTPPRARSGAANLTSIQYSGSGTNNAFGQAYAPGGPWPAFKVTSYTASINYATPAMRIELERTNPDGVIRGGGGLPLLAPQRQVQVVSGDVCVERGRPERGAGPGRRRRSAARDLADAARGDQGGAERRRADRRSRSSAAPAARPPSVISFPAARRRRQGDADRRPPGRARRDARRRSVVRRHHHRDDLLGLPRLRRREIPDPHRPDAGRLSDADADDRRRPSAGGRHHRRAAERSPGASAAAPAAVETRQACRRASFT